MTTTLAVDVGGTTVKAGLVSNGTVLHSTVFDAHGTTGAQQMLTRLAPILRDLRSAAGPGGLDCRGVGIALPTLVDSRQTRVLTDMVGKFEGIANVDLRGWAEAELDLPVKIENDAHAALLGEWRFGAGIGEADLAMITLGTGIGTSVILGGKPLRGSHSQAGNLGGHIVMQPDGPPCSCGGKGCAESLHYLDTVNRLARQDVRFASSSLSSLDRITYTDLFKLASTDALASGLQARSLDIWGAVSVSLIHSFACSRLIVGGGIMRSAEVILPRLKEWMHRAFTPWGSVDVCAGQLGDSAALLGVASLFDQPPDFI